MIRSNPRVLLTSSISRRNSRTIVIANAPRSPLSLPKTVSKLPLLGERAGVRGNVPCRKHAFDSCYALSFTFPLNLTFSPREKELTMPAGIFRDSPRQGGGYPAELPARLALVPPRGACASPKDACPPGD